MPKDCPTSAEKVRVHKPEVRQTIHVLYSRYLENQITIRQGEGRETEKKGRAEEKGSGGGGGKTKGGARTVEERARTEAEEGIRREEKARRSHIERAKRAGRT